jgi:cytochrome b6-f complex iron-sulfur subunit
MQDIKRLIEDSREMSRRSFFSIAGWGAFTVGSAIALWESLGPPPVGKTGVDGSGGFLNPNVLYEDPAAFKAGLPADYALGSTTVLTDKRVVINRDPNGFYAISLICTHLGCTPRFFSDVTSDLVTQGISGIRDPDTRQVANKANPILPGFKCPCHGSRYFRDAINFFGPAPRPMDRVSVELGRDGRLLIDRSVVVDRNFRLKA